MPDKKKILIMMPAMYIGGAERSLLGLLEALDYSRVDVSLFLFRHEGEFMNRIPPQVQVLPEVDRYRTFDVPIRDLLCSRKCLFGMARLLSKIALRMHCAFTGETPGTWMSLQYTSHYLQPLLPAIPGEYDLGINFLSVADTLCNKVHAKVRITWCHTDYDTLNPSRRMDRDTYAMCDYVATVSEPCRAKLLKHYPELQDKAIVVENTLATDLMKAEATRDAPNEMEANKGVRLLSIGRYCEAKNFDNLPDICKKVRAMGHDVTWYIIGYGGDEELIRQKIAEAGMEDYVVLLGKKENPYPYIAECDLYVQPSRYEGKSVTVREAQALGKPVVITRYATSANQLEDGVDGMIVPMDNEGCAAGIAALLNDPKKMRRLAEACSARDYSNADEVNVLYSLMNQDTALYSKRPVG